MTELKKTLVCVIAETRAHRLTWTSHKKNLLDELQADLALCISTPPDYDFSNPFWREAKYKWVVPEYSDWGQAFDYAQDQLVFMHGLTSKNNWRIMLSVKEQWLGGIEGDGKHPGSAAILIYFRWYLLQMLKTENLIDKYDRFIITRSDFIWENPHPPLKLLYHEKIWVPDGEAYGGVTDRHTVLSSQHLVPYLNIIEPILIDTPKLYEAMKGDNGWNLEQFILFILSSNNLSSNISYFPYCMYSVREPDGTTRWQKGTWFQDLGYFIKYVNEYESAKVVKKFLNNNNNWEIFLNSKSNYLFNALLQFKNSYFCYYIGPNHKTYFRLLNIPDFLHSDYALHIDFFGETATMYKAKAGLGFFEREFLESVILHRISEDTYHLKSTIHNLYFGINNEGFLCLTHTPLEFTIKNRYKYYPHPTITK